MTIHRPDFATVTLANDLRKLEEDWLKLEQVAMRKAAVDYPSDLNRSHIFAAQRNACTLTRTHLIEGVITWHIARLKRDMLEAAFDVVRRSINDDRSDEPIPFVVDHAVPGRLVPDRWADQLLTREEQIVDEVPC